MTITNIQDNTEGGCTLLSTGNPLIFVAEVDWTGEAERPDVYAKLTGIGVFRALPFADVSATVTRYRFDARPVLVSVLGSMDDEAQAVGTAMALSTGYAAVHLRMQIEEGLQRYDVNFTAVRAAKQWGESPALPELESPAPVTYLAGAGQAFYVYHWLSAHVDALRFEGAETVVLTDCAAGWYRYLCSGYAVSGTVDVFENDVQVATPSVYVSGCAPAYEAKYMDAYGRYRFLPFDGLVEIQQNPEKRGSVEFLGYGIALDTSDVRSIGISNEMAYVGTVGAVPPTLRETVALAAESPRVYFRKAGGAWVLVDSVQGPPVVKTGKGQFDDLQFTFKVKRFTNTML